MLGHWGSRSALFVYIVSLLAIVDESWEDQVQSTALTVYPVRLSVQDLMSLLPAESRLSFTVD